MSINPHPYADLIKIWADTGCPVWVRYTEPTEDGLNIRWRTIKTNTPDWNIPGAECRLTPFED